MKFKRLSILFALVLALSTFFSSIAFAENNVKPNLVGLGDSITFGYKLEENQTMPSSNAFPSLIGNGNYNVTNLGVPGWTSTQLLDALNNNPTFSLAIQNADVITLDIGNNDILQAADLSNIIINHTPVDPVALQQKVDAAAIQISQNLQTIILKTKQLNPNAPIIFYNFYNPIGVSIDPFFASLHIIGEQIIQGVNLSVLAPFSSIPGIYMADAYSAFNGHQSQYIFGLPIDLVHPNLAGHQALAALATEILSTQVSKAITIDLSASTTKKTKGPVTINVSTSAKKELALQWLLGEKTIEDFAEVGTGNDITNKQFQVTENGIYTVYVRDSYGAKSVKTIIISNIKEKEKNLHEKIKQLQEKYPQQKQLKHQLILLLHQLQREQ